MAHCWAQKCNLLNIVIKNSNDFEKLIVTGKENPNQGAERDQNPAPFVPHHSQSHNALYAVTDRNGKLQIDLQKVIS